MKISNLILSGFLLILIMFSITTYINFRQTERVNENSEWFAKSTTIMRESNRFQRNILNMVSGLRGYLFTGENYFIQTYDSAAIENQQILDQLNTIIPDTSAQKSVLQDIKKLSNEWMSTYATPLIEAKKAADNSDSSRLSFNTMYRERLLMGDEQAVNRKLQQRLREISNYEYLLRDKRKESLSKSIQQTRIISFYLNTFSIVVGLLIAFFLAYRISVRIMQMVKMADNIAAGNYEVYTKDTSKDELSRLARSLNHMARTLSENIALLKRKNEELDQFAHIVSHDLKAPLRGIDNVVTWIEEDHNTELTPKLQEYITLIKGRLIRAENLIQGILSYARVGRELQPKEAVNLNLLLQDIQENLKVKPGLKIQAQPNMGTIETERIPLQQVLSNLIGNAIKYHDKNDGRIMIKMKDHQTHYQFTVQDDGPGIDKVYHDKIFVIFQTLKERDSFESTGVGLAIVKKILEDRKQTITVNSERGKGATFSFTWAK